MTNAERCRGGSDIVTAIADDRISSSTCIPVPSSLFLISLSVSAYFLDDSSIIRLPPVPSHSIDEDVDDGDDDSNGDDDDDDDGDDDDDNDDDDDDDRKKQIQGKARKDKHRLVT
ncbi:hypothetical protein V1477_001195 [Vespula maculifrons]|uniref:Uncharacterized protein n=1 Tax=Vespula maculifrons TaxID=7453 RepID=A0ABD2D1A3_VESMC